MSLQVYPPVIIYYIIVNKFLPHRGFRLISDLLTTDEIISNMEKIGYLQITAINEKNPRNDRNKILILLLKNNESGILELKKIKKIIDYIENHEYFKTKTLDETFIIVNKDFFEKKNFIDIIKELIVNQKGDLDLEGKSMFYTICPYHNFAFDVSNCKNIYPHEIMTKEEVDMLLKTERINIKDLPTILSNDVTIIWNGARIGQIIRILRKSEAALESIYYRKVEPAIH